MKYINDPPPPSLAVNFHNPIALTDPHFVTPKNHVISPKILRPHPLPPGDQ